MLQLLGIDMETVLIGFIIYGVILTISNSILAVKTIRENMNKKALGTVDLISGIIMLTTWNNLFRDSEYISNVFFWIVFAWCAAIMIAGALEVTLGIISCDSRH